MDHHLIGVGNSAKVIARGTRLLAGTPCRFGLSTLRCASLGSFDVLVLALCEGVRRRRLGTVGGVLSDLGLELCYPRLQALIGSTQLDDFIHLPLILDRQLSILNDKPRIVRLQLCNAVTGVSHNPYSKPLRAPSGGYSERVLDS